MKHYFHLQFLITNRKIKETGINPILAYLLGLAALILITAYIFQKTEFAKYTVLLTCLSLLSKLSENNRTDFLIATFGDRLKNKIRILENGLVSIPFVMVLLYQNAWLEAALLWVIAIILAVFSFKTNVNFTLPTPFSKRPFEFLVGFRKTFYLFPMAYLLTVIAIQVGNFNLGIFSMLLIFGTVLSYFAKPEQAYYVWVHAYTPKKFLIHKKIATATQYTSILVAPVLVGLLMFYPNEYHIVLLFFLIGLLFVWTIILGKYSAYPNEMSLPEGMLLAFSVYFPPMLLVMMPFFYHKSIQKLKMLLDDQD
jgi:hypothetical protein